MATPATRTPIKLARGSYSNLYASIDDLQEGEIVYAEDQNQLYVKEGSQLIDVTGDGGGGGGSTNLSYTTSGAGLSLVSSSGSNTNLPAATTDAWGLMTDEDKTKLDGIAASANNYSISSDLLDEDDMASDSATKAPSQQSVKAYVTATGGATNLSNTANGTSLTIESSSGNNTSLPAATTSAWGVMTDEDKTNLDANTAKVTNATHTGDVTGSGALTIADDAVTYAKMQNVSATDRVLGRDSAGAGVVEEITPANLRTMINVEDGATADQSNAEIRAAVEAASDSNVFTDDDHSKLNGIAANANNYVHPNHSGDVTSSADGATTIANDAVTTAKIEDDAVTADKLANSINTEIAANTAKVTNATHTGDVTGATTLTIANDKIEEKHINAGGTPGADKVLVYDSGEDTNWKWADQSGSGSGTPEGTAVLSTGETGTAKFLRVDGDGSCSWQVPPDTNTQVSIDDTPVNGVTDEAISSNWAYDHNAATGNSAHVPAAGSSGQFLKHDGTWGTPPDTNTQVSIDDTPVNGVTDEAISSNWAYDHNAATGNSAHVPAAGSSGQFLKHDGTWGTPPDTTYSVQDGQLSQNNFTDADHTKLNGIADNANNYSHPNHSGDVTSSGDGATTIADLAVTNAKIADDTISEAKLDIHADPSGTDKVLGYTANGMEWVAQSGGGGGGTPGGSNTQVQYNSSGSFAGSSNLTFDGTNLTVGGTATAVSPAVASAGLRKIFTSASSPQASDGAVGDIWLKF